MISRVYEHCNAIIIWGWIGMALDNGREMTRAEYDPFEQRIYRCLEKLRSIRTGREIFGNIARTGKRVKIHYGAPFQDSAAKMDPNVTANGPAAAIKPFRPAHHNVNIGLKGSERAWRGLDPNDNRTVQKGNIKLQMQGLNLPTHKAQTAVVMQQILNRAQLGMALEPRLTNSTFRRPTVELPVRIGVNSNDFDNMVVGLEYMTDQVYYSLAFLLYDFMIPGDGTNTQIRFADQATFDHDFAADLAAESKFTRKDSETKIRLEATVLGHELIHAWRMMAGRKVVASGWEEEAMTSGIGPFMNWRMTENCLRADFGLKSRKVYANPTHSSALMQGIATNMSATAAYRGIMF